MHSTTSSSGMITFVILLSAFFALLRLLGSDEISWIWVLSPLWITALSVPALYAIIALRVTYLNWRDARAAKTCPRQEEAAV